MLPKLTSAVLVVIVAAAMACTATAATDAPATGSPDPSWVTTFITPPSDQLAARDLFEVDADDPEYWRILTLDRYDGERWTSTNLGGSQGGVPLSVPATLPRPAGSPPDEARTLNQTFRILGNLAFAHALPMAQTAEAIDGPIGDIVWDPAGSEAFIDDDLHAGMEYSVRSRIVAPTPEELDRVEHRGARTYGPWIQLPSDLDPRIAKIAQRWTADATSNYRKVLAIQERFHNGDFAYDTAVGTAVEDDTLVEFLEHTRAGFCHQYSSAMAVMVRTLGLPARIGLGYRSGTRQEDGTYLVRANDTHVWVEVLFPGYGWLQFEPEPGPTPHPNAQPGTYLDPGGSD